MTRGPRFRRVAVIAAASLTLGVLGSASVQAVAAQTNTLHQAQDHLSALQKRIKARRAKLAHLEHHMNMTAKRIDHTQSALAEIQHQLDHVAVKLAEARAEITKLQDEMNQRIRAAYIQGPGTPIELVLTAPTYNSLVERLSILDHMTQTDAELADQIKAVAAQLQARTQQLTDLQQQRTDLLNLLNERRQKLQSSYDEQHKLLSYLADQRAIVMQQITALQPFAVCPVMGPRAYSDDFGAPRTAGGYHPHAGNDILAPMGARIVAPFDGTATASHDTLGGLTVNVTGADGYVYNAHLSRIGKTGQVRAGDVVGYVGNSGDARGGPTHDHFEWHPNSIPSHPHKSPYGFTKVGDAIDPYPFLMQVC
ncbi:MAG: murein hydrolase activator EnvC family protein [Actinomycetota bacterium]